MLERIEVNSKVLVGKPVIRRTRLSVAYIVGLLAHGAVVEEIAQDHLRLRRDDVRACRASTARSRQDLDR